MTFAASLLYGKGISQRTCKSLAKKSAPPLPRIIDFNWYDGDQYLMRHVLRDLWLKIDKIEGNFPVDHFCTILSRFHELRQLVVDFPLFSNSIPADYSFPG